LPVIITLVVGLMLTIMPLPESIRAFRPDWLALLMIFWAMQLPRTWSVGSAWVVGIVLDVAGTVLYRFHNRTLSPAYARVPVVTIVGNGFRFAGDLPVPAVLD
jgi:rod shape-determining protein MreD